MILYLDSSAIVKKYIVESGSDAVEEAVARSEINGTSVISRAEVTAAVRKAVRLGNVGETGAKEALRHFDRTWNQLVRTRLTEKLVKHASTLAWTYNLRGYDSVHLASAAAWQQALGRQVVFITFDRALWTAATEAGLSPLPKDLPQLLREWRS